MAQTARDVRQGRKEMVRSEQRPIDLVHLARQTLGDPGMETEVLILFDQMARTYLDRLKAGPAADDTKITLHSLKGAAAGIGANGIAVQSRGAEEELRQTGELSAETLGDIAMAVEETSTFIAELLQHA